jgi:hypothetical protein
MQRSDGIVSYHISISLRQSGIGVWRSILFVVVGAECMDIGKFCTSTAVELVGGLLFSIDQHRCITKKQVRIPYPTSRKQ